MSSNYSTSNNHGDSVVDIDYLSADNNDAVLWSARMALAAAEEGQAPVGGNASANNHNSNSNNNNNNNANSNSNSNSNPNEQYGAMNGFRRLHRDYLRDLEDQVVMGLPWPTPSDRQEVSDLLRRRSLSKTRANQISTCVFGYCVVSIGFWLLYGVVLGADIQGEDNEGKNNINNSKNNNNNNNKGFLTVLLGISYVGALVMMMYGHIRYYRLDGKVQFLVRAIMDANGLGYRDPYGEHPELLRTDTNQRAQFRLPEFVDVILRTVAAEDTNSLDDEFSTVTFRDSIMKSVTSGSAGTHHTGTGAETGNAAVRWSRRIWGYGSR